MWTTLSSFLDVACISSAHDLEALVAFDRTSTTAPQSYSLALAYAAQSCADPPCVSRVFSTMVGPGTVCRNRVLTARYQRQHRQYEPVRTSPTGRQHDFYVLVLPLHVCIVLVRLDSRVPTVGSLSLVYRPPSAGVIHSHTASSVLGTSPHRHTGLRLYNWVADTRQLALQSHCLAQRLEQRLSFVQRSPPVPDRTNTCITPNRDRRDRGNKERPGTALPARACPSVCTSYTAHPMNQKHHGRSTSRGQKVLPPHARPSRPPALTRRTHSYNAAYAQGHGQSSSSKLPPSGSRKAGVDAVQQGEEEEDMFLQFWYAL